MKGGTSCTIFEQPPVSAWPDAAELMDRREPADDRVIAHFHMPGERAVVGKNDVVPDDAVVRDVRVGEEISAAADPRDRARRSAAMHGHELAEGVAVADAKMRRLADVFQILRLLADGAEGVEAVAAADLARSARAHVMLQPALRAECHVRADHAVWTDLAVFADLRCRIDDRRGMNLRRAHVSTKPNIISASRHDLAVHDAAPAAFTIDFFRCIISTSMKSVSPGTTGLRNFTASALMK